MALLELKNLRVCFQTQKGVVRAVDNVSFSLESGKTLGVVGESGSGKSVSAMSVLKLLDENGKIESGEILFDEKEDGNAIDLTRLPKEKMYAIRGNKISMIFQEPMTALNPVLTIKRQLCEPFVIHRNMKKKEAEMQALKMLEAVQIPAPKRVLNGYAHQLSGGMRQRVMIAMALACEPKLLIADEPTTALDVTIQAQILALMKKLQKENGAAVLLITHDLGVVGETADDVAVMYCGQVVEQAPKDLIFKDGRCSHPYTEGLLLSTPNANSTRSEKNGKKRLETIAGNVPHPLKLPKGCKFSPRCKYCTQKCIENEPPLFEVERGQKVRCFYADKEERRSERHAKRIIRRET